MIGKPQVVVGSSSGAPPPPPPPPPVGGAIVCADCGRCSFSPGSYMRVTKFIPTCGPGLIITPSTSDWPWVSSTGSATRWQLDPANWIEYLCVSDQWTFEASGLEDIGSLPCIQSTVAGFFFFFADPCAGFEWRKETASGVDTTFLRAVLINNVCVPSEPVVI